MDTQNYHKIIVIKLFSSFKIKKIKNSKTEYSLQKQFSLVKNTSTLISKGHGEQRESSIF